MTTFWLKNHKFSQNFLT